MPSISLAAHELSDLRLLLWGGYAPLDGFLEEADYRRVVQEMRLESGALWSLPITISLEAPPPGLKGGGDLELLDAGGRVIANLHHPDVYRVDQEAEARAVYGTSDPAHPGVARVLTAGSWRVGGRVTRAEPSFLELQSPFDAYPASPARVRELIAGRGWSTVAAFQTRNPIHRAHEYVTKLALEGVDGLLLHPLVGETKSDDIPAEVRLRCYRALLDGYYPPDRTLLALFPAPMRYAGPREAIFHARVRANYGATHLIIGRDHAGVGSYYGPYDAHQLLRRFSQAEIGLTPLFFENAFFCRACGQMATRKTCPHDPAQHVSLSGTKVRELLAAGELPPAEFSRPEVARLLVDAYRDQVPEAAGVR